jgi:hypothetical protein
MNSLAKSGWFLSSGLTLSALAILLMASGCAPESSNSVSEVATAVTPGSTLLPSTSPVVEKPRFTNKVWKVSTSTTVAPGTLYTFLSEGTLVIASPKNKPALGQWLSKGDDLVMVEEGQSYRVEVLKLSAEEFRIKMFNPGEPVDITFIPG